MGLGGLIYSMAFCSGVRMVRSFRHPEGKAALRVAISAEGNYVASSHSGNGQLCIWTYKGALIDRLEKTCENSGNKGLDFTPDETCLAINNRSEILLYDVAGEQLSGELKAYNAYSLACLSDSKRIAIGSGHDREIQIWDLAKRKKVKGIPAETINPKIAVSRDDRWCVSLGGADDDKARTLNVWDLKAGVKVRQIAAHQKGMPDAVAITADGKKALSINSRNGQYGWTNEECYVWDLKKGKHLCSPNVPANLMVFDQSYPAAAFSPNKDIFVVALSNDAILVCDATNGAPLGRAACGKMNDGCVSFARGSNYFATGECDGTIRIWKLK